MELKLERAKVEDASDWLLIVPYGIETMNVEGKNLLPVLLIVPYGIETPQEQTARDGRKTFNRTLWN